jgi:hypothetical protein
VKTITTKLKNKLVNYKMNHEEIVKKVYLSPRTGFKSIDTTYKTIKELYPNEKIKRKEVENCIKNNSVHEIHTHQKINPSDYNQIKAQQLGFFQLDLIQMTNYKKYNEGYNYILIAVDVKSRFSLMEKVKTKTAEEVYKAFLKMEYYCESVGNRIYAIYSDKGGEFSKPNKNKDKIITKFFIKNRIHTEVVA